MKVLLVSATELEQVKLESFEKLEIEKIVTGVGMTSAAFALGEHYSQHTYDLAINIGLAGSFDRSIELGEVVEVKEDRFSEEGAEDGNIFLSLEDIGLRKADEFPFNNGVLQPTYSRNNSSLKSVRGITVNTVHGEGESISAIINRLNPQIESMEGAAFFYASLRKEIPCMQLRAISNYVEKRDRESWKISEAMNNLAHELEAFLSQLDANN